MFSSRADFGEFLDLNKVEFKTPLAPSKSYRVQFLLVEAGTENAFKLPSGELAQTRGETAADAAESFAVKFGGETLRTDSGKEIAVPCNLKIGSPFKG